MAEITQATITKCWRRQILGTLEEIKKGYRKKAIHDRPDRNPGDKKADEKILRRLPKRMTSLCNPDKTFCVTTIQVMRD